MGVQKTEKSEIKVGIIGAGPAGLTAGYLLSKNHIQTTIFEMDSHYVGGIARTVHYKDFCFDIGGHRFFSKSQQVEDFWTEVLPDDMLVRPRSSRILYRGKYFSYPLSGIEALVKLGVVDSFLCVFSFIKAKIFPKKDPKSFEDWVINQFGNRLYRIFFKTYTEKVWGMNCKDISSEWAAQRIKGLSLGSAILSALLPKITDRKKVKIKTLLNSFRYPTKGPGMLWDACAKKFQNQGGVLQLGSQVVRCEWNGETRKWSLVCKKGTSTQLYEFDHVISTMPIRLLVEALVPFPSSQMKQAARSLNYRDFIIVVLILKEKNMFSDNWIYVHDVGVKVGRIQNFKSWSPFMVPDPSLCCYGMEYFCFKDDRLWSMSDQDLIEFAKKEIVQIHLAAAEDVVDGCVVRQEKAYPVYDATYKEHVETIKQSLAKSYPQLHLVGRNGMHKYNNQDHSMMTSMLTVENIIAGEDLYDPWNVNQDAEYIEEKSKVISHSTSGLRDVPMSVTEG